MLKQEVTVIESENKIHSENEQFRLQYMLRANMNPKHPSRVSEHAQPSTLITVLIPLDCGI